MNEGRQNDNAWLVYEARIDLDDNTDICLNLVVIGGHFLFGYDRL